MDRQQLLDLLRGVEERRVTVEAAVDRLRELPFQEVPHQGGATLVDHHRELRTGIPEVVSWVGPVHGGAFLVYIAMVLVVTSAKPWTSLDSLKLLLAAFIPFGAWMVSGSFKRVATELAATKGAAGTRP